jgi:hypothetical protein
MKLNEILRVASLSDLESKIKLSQEQINNAKSLGFMAHSFEVFEINGEVGGLKVFYAKKEENIIGQLALEKTEICKISGYICRRSYIIPSEEKKGYGSDFYVFIRKYLKSPMFAMFSDESQTPDGINLWKSLSKRFDVKVLNIQTGEIKSRKDVNDDIIYTNDADKSADFMLMIESAKAFAIPTQSYIKGSILTPYALFEDGDY